MAYEILEPTGVKKSWALQQVFQFIAQKGEESVTMLKISFAIARW